MTTAGGSAARELEALDASRQSALSQLLDLAARLVELGGQKPEFAATAVLGETLAAAACKLAGIEVDSGPFPSRSVIVLELERPTTALWNCHAYAFGERVVAHYVDGPSRKAAVANALASLASGVICQGEVGDVQTPELVLHQALEEAIASYDGNLCAVAEARRELELERMSEGLEPECEHSGELAIDRATGEETCSDCAGEPSFHGEGPVE